MIRKLTLLVFALPLASIAQLQLFQFDGTHENLVGTTYEAGTVGPGDTLETRFRVRNMSTSQVIIQTIAIAPASAVFQVEPASKPSPGYVLAPGAPVDFRVAFSPTGTGSFTASLLVNTLSVTVHATSVPSAAVFLEGATTALTNSAAIDFGSIERGSSKLQGFRLTNSGTSPVLVSKIAVAGTGFRGPIGLAAPVPIGPGQSIPFQVAFEPQAGQAAQGTLTVDQRSFQLTGQGLDPPLPAASITFGSQAAGSAMQMNVSIPLAAASKVGGTGTLSMAFQPGVSSVTDDPAILFLSGPKRVATVTITAGDATAKFGAAASLGFQTGTTAGTIVFTLKLPNGAQQTSLTIAPAPVSLDTATGVARIGDLDVSLVGFDNTHSISQMAFTFYDKSGKPIAPGRIGVDESSAFRSYFGTGQYGGTFALRATFPVTGDSLQVGGVDVELINSAGTIKTQRISF